MTQNESQQKQKNPLILNGLSQVDFIEQKKLLDVQLRDQISQQIEIQDIQGEVQTKLELIFKKRDDFQKDLTKMTKDCEEYQQVLFLNIQATGLGLDDNDLDILMKFLVKLNQLEKLQLDLSDNKIKNLKNYAFIKFDLKELEFNISKNKLTSFKLHTSILRLSNNMQQFILDLRSNSGLSPSSYLSNLCQKLQKSLKLKQFSLYIEETDISNNIEENDIKDIQEEFQKLLQKALYLNCFIVDILEFECCPLKKNYFINFQNKSCDLCYDSHCQKCYNDKFTCIKCQSDYYLLDTNCRTQCPYGYIPDENDNVCTPIEKILNYEIKDNEELKEFVKQNLKYMEFIQEIYLFAEENFRFNQVGAQAITELFAIEDGLPDLFILEFYFDNINLSQIDIILSQIISSCFNLKSVTFFLKNNEIDNFYHTMSQLAKLQTLNNLEIQLDDNPIIEIDFMKQYMEFIKQNRSIQSILIDIMNFYCQIYNKNNNEYRFYDVKAIEEIENCALCSDKCGRCLNKNQCLTCKAPNEYVHKNECITECPNGYFQNQKDKTCVELQPSTIQENINSQQEFDNFLATFQPSTVVNLKKLQVYIQYQKGVCYQDQIDYLGNIFSSLNFPMLEFLDFVCDRCQINSLQKFADGVIKLQKINQLFLNFRNNLLQTQDVISIMESMTDKQLVNLQLQFSNNLIYDSNELQDDNTQFKCDFFDIELIDKSYKEVMRYQLNMIFIQFDLIQANCYLEGKNQETGEPTYNYPDISDSGKCKPCPGSCSRCYDQQICYSCLNDLLVQENTNICSSTCPSGFHKMEGFNICTTRQIEKEDSSIKYILFIVGISIVIILLITLIIIMVLKILKLKQQKKRDRESQELNSKLINHHYDQSLFNTEIKVQEQQCYQQSQICNNSNQCNSSRSQNTNTSNSSNKVFPSLSQSNNSINSNNVTSNKLIAQNQFNIFSSLYNEKVEVQEQLLSLEKDLKNPKVLWNQEKFNNRFQFLSLLGQGAYGKVYKYFDKQKQTQIAIKEIQMVGDLQHIIKKEAYNEINNLKKMSNIPNIVQLISYYILEIDQKTFHQQTIPKINEEIEEEKEDESNISGIQISDIQSSRSSSCNFSDSCSDQEENRAYKMMICLELGQSSLETFVLRQKQKIKKLFTQKVILQIMFDIIKACNDLQNVANFAHRDIKPKNILYANQKWKLCDFGSAKNLGKQIKNAEKTNKTMTRRNTMIGTVNYLSPELKTNYVLNALQKQENPINPFKSDIFSLGITFFEVVTLGNINGMNDRPDLLEMKIKINLLSKSDIYDARIIQVISSMLSWEPNERPSYQNIFEILSQIN